MTVTATADDRYAAKEALHRWSLSVRAGLASHVAIDFWVLARMLNTLPGTSPAVAEARPTEGGGWKALVRMHTLSRLLYNTAPKAARPGLEVWLDEETPGWRER